MELVMNTENVRSLAGVFGDRSDEADSLATRILANLDLAAMDDTNNINATLGLLSEDLHVGDIALRHQADIMDGLTVDVDALSEDLGVEAWRVEQQLRRVEEGKLETSDLVISLIDWGKDDITGLDTTIRDFIPDAPEIGEDPEFDALIQRLDGWLLSTVVDRREGGMLAFGSAGAGFAGAIAGLSAIASASAEFATNGGLDERTADLRELAVRMGVTDATTRSIDDVLSAVTTRLGDQRKLGRVGNLPSLGELFDVTWTESEYRDWEGNSDDGEYVTKLRRGELTIEEQEALVESLNNRFADLEWLPEVLAGQANPPPELATDPALQALLVDFASHHHYRANWDRRYRSWTPANATAALQYLRGKNLITTTLEHPRPAQKARLPFAETTLDNTIEFGRQQGAITAANEADARAVALHLAGLDPTVDVSTLDPADLAAEAAELNVPEFVSLLSGTVPPHQLTEQRLVQAVSYVQQAATVEERVRRIEQAVLGLMTVSTVGEAATTTHQFRASLPDKVKGELTDIHVDSRDFNWLLERSGIPGYHKSPDMRSGSGKRYYHLVNEADGLTSDFVVERIPKKKGFFAKYGLTIIKVGISFFVPAAAVVFAAMDAVQAAANGDWLNAGLAAAGALAGGAAVWASASGSALAQTAAKAASFVNNGVKAGVAFARGDGFGGVINSVAALAAGASTFGMDAVGNNLANAAKVVKGIDTTIDAIKDDDIAGALAGGLTTGAAAINLSSSAQYGGVDPETMTDSQLQQVQDLSQMANTAQQAANVVRAGGAIVDGIENERWGELVGAGLRFGSATSQLLTDPNGAVAEHVLDAPSGQGLADQAAPFRTYEGWADAAADLADGGLALSRGDELGAAALISSGINGATRAGGLELTSLERIDAITNLADDIAGLPPGADMSTIMAATGGELQRLRETFRPSPDDVVLRAGDPGQTIEQIELEQSSLQEQQRRIDELRNLNLDDPLVGGVLADIDARVDHQLATLERESVLADEAKARADALEAARQAELTRRAEAARQPIEVTELGPLVEVQAGQTLSEIALANGVTVDEILAENPGITDRHGIQAGQAITLPPHAVVGEDSGGTTRGAGSTAGTDPTGGGQPFVGGGPFVIGPEAPGRLGKIERLERELTSLRAQELALTRRHDEIWQEILQHHDDHPFEPEPPHLRDQLDEALRQRREVTGEIVYREKEQRADRQLLEAERRAGSEYMNMGFEERVESRRYVLDGERSHLRDLLGATMPGTREAIAIRERLADVDRQKALLDDIVATDGPTRVEELNDLDAGFMVIDTGFHQANSHYFSGDGSDVILGAETRKKLRESPEQRQLIAELEDGTKRLENGEIRTHWPDLEYDPDIGTISFDLPLLGDVTVGVFDTDTYHVGNTDVEYSTDCGDGEMYCTATFTSRGDGIRDPGPDYDKGGPEGEIWGGTTFRYRPFTWTERYLNPDYRGEDPDR